MTPSSNSPTTGLLALASLALAFASSTASATLTTYSPGDIFVGFRQTGVANTLVAKIGTVGDFLSTSLNGTKTPGVPFQVSFGVVPGSSTPASSLNADLIAVFGDEWANNPTDGSGVRWGVVGWNANTGETSSVAGLATRSLFVTRGRTDPSEQTSISSSISAIGDRGGFATAFTSFAYGLGVGSYINNESTANSSVAYIGAASDANNWGTRINTSNAGFGLGSNRAVDQTPLSGEFSGPTSSVLDLWLSPNTGSTLATTNTYLGSFRLSEDGTISFTPAGGVSAFDSWVGGYPSLTGNQRDRSADPDGDGWANAQEFAFGTNPTLPNGQLVEAGGIDSGNVIFTFLKRTDNTTYTILQSSDLAAGFSANGTSTPAANQVGVPVGYSRHEVRLPVSAGKGFLKVSATIP